MGGFDQASPESASANPRDSSEAAAPSPPLGDERVPISSASASFAASTTPAPTDTNASVTAARELRDNAAVPPAAPQAESRAVETLSSSIPRVHVRTPSRHSFQTPSEAGLHITIPTGSQEPSGTGSETGVQGNDLFEFGDESTSQSHVMESEAGASRTTLSAGSMHSQPAQSPASTLNSPALNALPDITPLPSPIGTAESPPFWKSRSRPGSAGSASRSLREEVLLEQASDRSSPMRMKKAYGSLASSPRDSGSPSRPSPGRAISDFQPDSLHNERPRNVTIGPGDVPKIETTMYREKHLAQERGMVQPAASLPGALSNPLPTPPSSNRSGTESEADDRKLEADYVEYLVARQGSSRRKRKYRPVRPLGQGTFSKVVLATSDSLLPAKRIDETSESWLNPKHLVAIKVVQHGPAGGADSDRIDLGLKREIEILRMLDHPSLIQLKAFDWCEQEALIVLNYCPGGDMFDVASQQRDLLTPPVLQRMFAELVDAVRYLHSLWVVHRDIKLENVLLNMPPQALAKIEDPRAYPHPLITLTDLGLSRKIPEPPESPLLTTRCGSEDYAAPEILLGQPYDGRQTDAWALGVFLYALMEGRLPFDPPPVRPGQRPVRGRTNHRIARCDWMWCEYGDEDGEWDPEKGAALEGARECVEALLKKVSRGRQSLDELAAKEYLKDGIRVQGGVRRPPHADDEEEE